jgi:hypothetical protein
MRAALIALILKLLGKILSILEITIESVYTWITKKRKMAKKTTTPHHDDGQPTEPSVKQIGANTQIIFTMKSFFATIGTILGLFFGFYELVVVPKVNKTEEHYEVMFSDQKEQNRIFYEELGKINSSIGSLSTSIENLNKTNPITQPVANTGGSFGGGLSASSANGGH